MPRVIFPQPRVKRRLLRAAQGVMQVCGAATAFVRAKNPHGALILVYHGIVSEEDSPHVDPRFSVPCSVFEAQMRYVSRHRSVMSLGQLIDSIERREPVRPGTVVLTFDDGYRSTLETAAPILRRYDLPATLFLPTGYISREQPQFSDVLYSAFNSRTREELCLENDGLGRVDLRDPFVVQQTYLALEVLLMEATFERRKRLLAEVVDQLRPEAAARRLTLTWEEVKLLRDVHRGIELGVHTRNHIDLTSCDSVLLTREVTDCVEDLRRELGVTAQHFAFPFGRSDRRASTVVRRAGFRSAAITEPAALVDVDVDRLALPRFSAPPSMSLFPFFTSGAYPDLSLAVLGRA